MVLALPSESWDAIISALPLDSKINCLSISRHIHDVAQRILFQTISIDLGVWEELNPANLDTESGVDPGTMQTNSQRRTAELLTRIGHDSRFAEIIRHLNVLSFVKTDHLDESVLNILVSSIRHLPQLRSFRWFGIFPNIPFLVANALQACTKLETLRIPARNGSAAIPHLQHLTSLSCLAIARHMGIDTKEGYPADELAACAEDVAQLIAVNAPTLRRLCVFSSLVHRLPPQMCFRLTHVDIWGPARLGMLEPLLYHASALRELSLVELTCRDIFPLFRQHINAFPALRRLKIMSLDDYHDEVELGGLAHFVRKNPRLQRLDFDLPGSTRTGAFTLLETISELKELEVLGVDLRSLTDEADFNLVAECLPTTLHALHLQSCWENLPINTPEVTALLDGLAALPRLALLHLEGPVASDSTSAEALAFAVPQLLSIGFWGSMWSIDRSDEVPVFKQWTTKQVAFRSEDTLGALGEWLLRYHVE